MTKSELLKQFYLIANSLDFESHNLSNKMWECTDKLRDIFRDEKKCNHTEVMPKQECDHDFGNELLLSMPPKMKCKKCGETK